MISSDALDAAVQVLGEDRGHHAVVVAVGDQGRLGEPRQVGGCGAAEPLDRLQLGLERLDAIGLSRSIVRS